MYSFWRLRRLPRTAEEVSQVAHFWLTLIVQAPWHLQLKPKVALLASKWDRHNIVPTAIHNLIVFTTVYLFYEIICKDTKRTIVEDVSFTVGYTEGIFQIFLPYYIFYVQNSVCIIFETFIESDRLLKQLGYTMNYKWAIGTLLGIGAFAIPISCIFAALRTQDPGRTILSVSIEFMLYSAFSLARGVAFLMVTLMATINFVKYVFLNKTIQKWDFTNVEQTVIFEQVKIVAKVHHQLALQCEHVCWFNFIPSMVCIVQTIIGLAGLIASAIFRIEIDLVVKMWILGQIVHLWSTLALCTLCKYESEKTASLLSGLHLQLYDSRRYLELMNALLQFKHQKIEFMSARFFVLDVKLITGQLMQITTLVMFLRIFVEKKASNSAGGDVFGYGA